jgi:hypothetical protein
VFPSSLRHVLPSALVHLTIVYPSVQGTIDRAGKAFLGVI